MKPMKMMTMLILLWSKFKLLCDFLDIVDLLMIFLDANAQDFYNIVDNASIKQNLCELIYDFPFIHLSLLPKW